VALLPPEEDGAWLRILPVRKEVDAGVSEQLTIVSRPLPSRVTLAVREGTETRDLITVFGATGFTGGLICRTLQRMGLPFAVAGRRREALEALAGEVGAGDVVVADATRPKTLGALFEGGTRVLINCAGPFLRYGLPVAEAAAEAGVHYMDTTGEQPFIKTVADRLDEKARAAGATMVSGMAFEYAVGDWASELAIRRSGMPEIEHLSVGYSLRGEGVSRGTALSVYEMAGRPAWGWEEGRWVRRFAFSSRRRMRFPFGERDVFWAPFGEIVFLARRGTVRTATTWMRFPSFQGSMMAWLNLAAWPVRPLARPLAGLWVGLKPGSPTPQQRRSSLFCIVASTDGSRVVTTGADPYGLTAKIQAMGAQHLLETGAPRGVRSPATMGLDPARTLKRIGVVVE